jgi:hypothetical protein
MRMHSPLIAKTLSREHEGVIIAISMLLNQRYHQAATSRGHSSRYTRYPGAYNTDSASLVKCASFAKRIDEVQCAHLLRIECYPLCERAKEINVRVARQ